MRDVQSNRNFFTTLRDISINKFQQVLYDPSATRASRDRDDARRLVFALLQLILKLIGSGDILKNEIYI